MTFLVTKILYFSIFILKTSYQQISLQCADITVADITNADIDYLDTVYTFSPELGTCYEVFEQSEAVTSLTCQKPTNFEKYSCVKWISQHGFCFGLQTPTNESIEFFCKESEKEALSFYPEFELGDCFQVYAVDNTFKRICLKQLDSFSTGIITPDNFTILIDSYFCKPFLTIGEIEIYHNFVSNFSFDPEIRSCYKIYKPDQEISPYTCLNKDVYTACVQQLPEYGNCMGIKTPNNETVLLGCSNRNQMSERPNCFDIITADNKVHSSCQKKIEERCVGITTPSNLTLLFECHFCCKLGKMVWSYDVENQRKYRRFVKTYLTNAYLGKKSYLRKIEYEVLNQDHFIEPPACHNNIPKSYGYWIPNTNCYGLMLETNETIILECITKENKEGPGCFRLMSPEGHRQKICIEVLEERCVGITTPKNLSVIFACYRQEACSRNFERKFLEYPKEMTESYRLYPILDTCFPVYDVNQKIDAKCPKKSDSQHYTCINWIQGEMDCLGFKTSFNETIELLCRDSQSAEENFPYDSFFRLAYCFNVYSPNNPVEKVCQKKFGDYSIGITTPNNYSILFDSQFCTTYKTIYELERYKKFVESVKDVSFYSNQRRCYKIYTQDQEINQFTCLTKEVYDSCVHQLKDSNCIGITTQNNETVILHCPNDDRGDNKPGCFNIYSPDNIAHNVCLKELDGECIALTTPSNLTVLFRCQHCIPPGHILPARPKRITKYLRTYVEDTLDMYRQANYSFKDGFAYTNYDEVLKTEATYYKREISNYAIHRLYGHDNCLGLTVTESLETVILECPHKKPEKPGCFDIFSPTFGSDNKIIGPEPKVASVCVQIMYEQCVGIVTPSNWTLPLNCIHVIGTKASVVNVPNNGSPPRM